MYKPSYINNWDAISAVGTWKGNIRITINKVISIRDRITNNKTLAKIEEQLSISENTEG